CGPTRNSSSRKCRRWTSAFRLPPQINARPRSESLDEQVLLCLHRLACNVVTHTQAECVESRIDLGRIQDLILCFIRRTAASAEADRDAAVTAEKSSEHPL